MQLMPHSQHLCSAAHACGATLVRGAAQQPLPRLLLGQLACAAPLPSAARVCGATLMWGISGKLKKKYGVEGDVREVLYEVRSC